MNSRRDLLPKPLNGEEVVVVMFVGEVEVFCLCGCGCCDRE